MLTLYNTLTRKKEVLKPIHPDWVGLYTCGPTVYNFAHIGNLRTYIFEDILERTLRFNNYNVRRVMNVTDVGHLTGDSDTGDDKFDLAAQAEKKTPEEIARFYTDAFFADLARLNILKPDIIAPATEYIREQIALVQMLLEKGFAYDTPAAVYYDVSKFPAYGALSGQSLAEKIIGAREEVVVDSEKHNSADFALWFKLQGKFKNHLLHWPAPWGEGFPGWHVECSAIARHFLGQPFDIHTGGVDHIGTHHTNEIAQSEAAYDVPLAHIWMHGEFLAVDPLINVTLKDNIHLCPFCGHKNILKTKRDYIQKVTKDDVALMVKCEKCKKEFSGMMKMAKSEGNFLTLTELSKKGYHPLVYRYLVLGAHYRMRLNFTWESLDAAKNGIESLYQTIYEYAPFREKKDNKQHDSGEDQEQLHNYQKAFLEAINDDLNTSQALAILRTMLNSEMTSENKLTLVKKFDEVLGLQLETATQVVYEGNEKIRDKLVKYEAEYNQLRSNKQFIQSDALRKEIEALGYSVRDTNIGSFFIKRFFP